MDKQISKENFDEQWDYLIQDDLINGTFNLPIKEQINELSVLKYDKNGKIKFKKPSKKNNNKIKIGDYVSKSGTCGEVIDVDDNLICVRDESGNIAIWNVNDVKKIKKEVYDERKNI